MTDTPAEHLCIYNDDAALNSCMADEMSWPCPTVLRGRLVGAGFEPDVNVCGECWHTGGEHDVWNRCLVEDCPCLCFSSLNQNEQWAYALAQLESCDD